MLRHPHGSGMVVGRCLQKHWTTAVAAAAFVTERAAMVERCGSHWCTPSSRTWLKPTSVSRLPYSVEPTASSLNLLTHLLVMLTL